MVRLVTLGDFIDLFYKVRTRGLAYALKKFRLRAKNRIAGTWEETNICSANWWMIPKVKQRWNELITGDPNTEYADYITQKYFAGRSGLIGLSPACGTGSHEIKFAKYSVFERIDAFDIAVNTIREARKKQQKLQLENLNYFQQDIYNFDFGTEKYDFVLFHSSLHHFSGLEDLLTKVKSALKPDGLLFLNEYVGPNRFDLPARQVKEINTLLKNISLDCRRKFGTNSIKRKYYPPGKMRMILSDPSEAVESESILPTVNKYFTKVEEKMLGGNLLAFVLKDIAHNFCNEEGETTGLLEYLFEEEDKYLKDHPADHVFGIYKK